MRRLPSSLRDSLHTARAGFIVAAVSFAIAHPCNAAPHRAANAAPTPPVMRLGDAVKPLAYDVELTVVPTQEKFAGRIVIHLEFSKPTNFFWLNATQLDIHQAALVAGGKTHTATPVAGGRDFVGLRFGETIPAGRAVLTIAYEGVISRTETAGIFKQKDGDFWYAYTQFEAIAARRAFPCFDEPGWKVPWYLALVVPASDVAAANMPAIAEEAVVPQGAGIAAKPSRASFSAARSTTAGADAAIPMKRVRFEPTPPLPSYLIAFAVGPFDVVDGGRAGKKGTPLRYIVPKGRTAEVAYAKEATPKLLELLEDYFGTPYPFPKVDAVAIPLTVGFGAMENVGFITYAAPLLLARPEQEGERFKRDYASVAAHEMAHQWFGDLVTMQWWDDVWLNESFATWMSAKVVERYNPAWQTRLERDHRRQRAIAIDRLASTRQIRQPVATRDDLANAFDGITYQKGAAVLAMFEHWLGDERFRNGVRRYLVEHAQGSAKAEDFFAAVAAEAGSDHAALVPGLKSFIEQPGVPRLDVALDCGSDGPKLLVSQSRFLADRPLSDTARPPRWIFPVCFQYGRGGDFGETCTVIREARTVLPLPAGERCPQWVLPNIGGTGYFVPVLNADLAMQLTRTPLLPEEAVPALDDSATLAQTGDWPIDSALEFAARFANHRQPPVAAGAVALAETANPAWLADASERDAYARYVTKVFGARARSLGWTTKSGDREGDALLRNKLVPWVADAGNDSALKRDADRLARDWLAGKVALPGSLRPVLESAARSATGASGRELVDAYAAALDRAVNRDRDDLLAGLGAFRDPALFDAALDAALSDRIDARDGVRVLRAASEDARTAPLALRYLRDHYDAIVKRLPEDYPASLPKFGSYLCDAGEKTEFESFFSERATKVPGGMRNMAQALEEINICIAAGQAQRPRLKAFLTKQ